MPIGDLLRKQKYTIDEIIQNYEIAAKRIAVIGFYSPFKKDLEIDIDIHKWVNWEREYANLGYTTIPLNEFVDSQGKKKDISNLLSIQRKTNEEPRYYALEFQNNFFSKD